MANIKVSLEGIIVAHFMVIPHFILIFIVSLAAFARNKQNVCLKVILAAFLIMILPFLPIPAFFIDFWGLVFIYSDPDRSFGEATDKAFIEMPYGILNGWNYEE